MLVVAEVERLPWDAVRIRTLGPSAEKTQQTDAEVVDGESLEKSVAADEVFRDEELLSVALGQNFLNAADLHAVCIDHSPAEEQLYFHLIFL